MAKKAIKTEEYKKLMRYLEEDKNIRHTTKNKYFKIFTFLYYTGCRINEVCKLKTEDIQNILTYQKAKVLTTKTKRFPNGEFRTVHFSDEAIKQIKKYFSDCLKHPEAYCIRAWNNKDKLPNITALTNYLNKYIKQALNDDEFGTHSFRRGLITEMILDEDIKPEIVQNFIGHKNYSTTTRYVNVTEEDIKTNLVR